MYKLAILISHPIQYHAPFFQALSKHPKINLTVYYCWDFGVDEEKYEPQFGRAYKWDIPLLEGYNFKFLKNLSWNPSSKRPWGQINPGIVKEIIKEDYDALWVHGYFFITDWLAFAAAKLSGTPIFIRGISHILDEKPLAIRALKRLILPALFKICSACLYIGKHNKDYYKFYGVPDKKLFLMPHVVNNDFFSEFFKKLKPKRKEIRKEFGFSDDRPVILFVGKLIDKKRPLWVLEAYKRIRKEVKCGLLYAGSGPLRGQIEKRIDEEDIPDVHLAGFLNQTEIPKAYTAGDILVLPSAYGETWGLVVNEGMNFELPVIVSNKVGCGPNLVNNDENGFIISALDDLTDKLSDLVEDEEKRKKFGKKSKEIISSWNIDKGINQTVKVLDNITK